MKEIIDKSTTSRPRASFLTLVCALCVAAAACTPTSPPDRQDSKTTLDYYLDRDRAEVTELLVAAIDDADDRVWASVGHLQDDAIAEALVRADERGVDVRVVGDEDNRTESGFALLEGADITPTYGDGGLDYLPEPNLGQLTGQCQDRPLFIQCTTGQDSGDRLVNRPGAFNLMSHTFFIIDERTIYNFSAPLSDGTTRWYGWRAESQVMREDFVREFKQLHGGVFAVTLNVYNGPIKSDVSNRPLYFTDEGPLTVRFNPQQRLIKSIIDEVYRARASVWIMTDELSNPFLIDALEYKNDIGLDVRVFVRDGPRFTSEVAAIGGEALDWGYVPTIVLIDEVADPKGKKWARSAHILSHPLWHTRAFEIQGGNPDDSLLIHPSDTYVDGNLWSTIEYGAREEQGAYFFETPETLRALRGSGRDAGRRSTFEEIGSVFRRAGAEARGQ